MSLATLTLALINASSTSVVIFANLFSVSEILVNILQAGTTAGSVAGTTAGSVTGTTVHI